MKEPAGAVYKSLCFNRALGHDVEWCLVLS
jgi:hypothetical protein